MQPASRFGQYEIIRRLGKSMNDVYLAMDTLENRQAALKLIKCSPDAVSKLILEAERRGVTIQQRLRSLDPRVLEIYDYGDLDGYFYVAMQYVEGRNLSEVLERDGRLSAYRAARIALEICGQLEKFHAFQPGDGTTTTVVHGDIKPSNIHLGPNDTVRLLDFGIAKTLRPDHDFTFHNFGSPSYCSPERLGRSQVDQQADLWAVGVTLYEMVAGAPPYQAEDTRKLERLIQSRRPPRALPGACPPGLKAVISKSLAPDASRRYPSAAAFYCDLKAFLQGEETVAEKEKRRSWKPNPTLESGQTPPEPPKAPETAPKIQLPSRNPRLQLLRAIAQVRRFLRNRKLRRTAAVAGRVAGAVTCMLIGMVVFIGTSYFWRYWTASRQLTSNLDYSRRTPADVNVDWALYKDLQRQFAFLGTHSPVDSLAGPLRMAYVQSGAHVLDAYNRSADPALRHFDWARAELCFTRAMELGAGDKETYARLAVAQGYLTLLKVIDWKGADRTELASLRERARDKFQEAALDAPQSPDPHLGLARIFIYSLPAFDRALSELRLAEHLGYRFGPRETEQEADAHRLRGLQELEAKNTAAARQDFDAARNLYHTIAGFSLADYHLRQIPDIPQPVPTRRAHTQYVKSRYRRWR
ncbi:MAG: serine/threonine-protein kinase [Bryobacteraceae bacterium]